MAKSIFDDPALDELTILKLQRKRLTTVLSRLQRLKANPKRQGDEYNLLCAEVIHVEKDIHTLNIEIAELEEGYNISFADLDV